jgi:uncharacterized heparinase superfamily protein
MPLHNLPRLFRTVRHLRPSQIYWRGRYTLRRRFARMSVGRDSGASAADLLIPAVRADFPASLAAVESRPPHEKMVAQLSRGAFEHLNAVRELGRPPDWLLGSIERDRLWTVTLHYHRWAYDLAQLASRKDELGQRTGELFVEYVANWIDRCDLETPGARQLAWNAYATATRITWWIRAALLLGPEWWSDRTDFRVRFLASLHKQAEFLAGNIEWDLRGNHLVRDAVGLAWAGRFLDGPRAAEWLRTATSLAGDQCREQVLRDGGHFERSPMYHLQVMDDLLTLLTVIDDRAVKREIETTLGRMAEFASWARHPDGGIPLLNDAALEDDFSPNEILLRLRRNKLEFDASPPRGGRHFPDTGLAIWHGDPWTVFFDVGPLGPDYQPGHGHADNLTLECSFDGARLFVDPGTHSYDRDDRRAYDRSTAAHNTVCIDRIDSSEVWHTFRVGRRAHPVDVDVRATIAEFSASAAHDGYCHLGGMIHRRRVQVADGGPLVITDRIEGRRRHRVEGGWLLEPGWAVAESTGGWEVRQGSRIVKIIVDGPVGLKRSLTSKPWHPRFGVEVATNRLIWEWQGALPLEVKTIVARADASG